MKKILLIFALVFAFSLTANAQRISTLHDGAVAFGMEESGDASDPVEFEIIGKVVVYWNNTLSKFRQWDGVSAWSDFNGGGGAGISDGDKGDIIVSGTGTVWSIDTDAVGSNEIMNGAVSLDEMADINVGQFYGRTVIAGQPQLITAPTVRSQLNIEDGSTADQTDAEIETAYNNQVAVVSQVDAEAGTSTTASRWTAERVKQAIVALGGTGSGISRITPNNYIGTQISRIQQAIDAANAAGEICYISYDTVNNTDIYTVTESMLGSSNSIIVFEHVTIKIADTARDNVFRTSNVGLGITVVNELENIHLIGVGKVLIEGADNPRSTGDAAKTLTLTPTEGGIDNSYGTDAGVGGQTQTGDWRNNMFLFAKTTNFSISGITFKDSHGYNIMLEKRCNQGLIKDVYFDSPEVRTIAAATKYVKNTDGIHLGFGAHDIVIENPKGHTGDDNIAMVLIDLGETAGVFGNFRVAGSIYEDEGDDIRNITIENTQMYSFGNGLRLLNSAPFKIYNIKANNITDTSDFDVVSAAGGGSMDALIKIGNSLHAIYGTPNGIGSCYNIQISNFSSANYTDLVRVQGSLSESFITNGIQLNEDFVANDEDPINFNGSIGVRNLFVSNVYKSGQDRIVHAIYNGFGDPPNADTFIEKQGSFVIDGHLTTLSTDYIPDNTYLFDSYPAIFGISTRKLSMTQTYGITVKRDSDDTSTDVELPAEGLIDYNSTVSATGDLGTWIGSSTAVITKIWNQGTGGSAYDVTFASGLEPVFATAGAPNLVSIDGVNYYNFDLTSDIVGTIGTALDLDTFSIYAYYFKPTVFTKSLQYILGGNGRGVFIGGTNAAFPRAGVYNGSGAQKIMTSYESSGGNYIALYNDAIVSDDGHWNLTTSAPITSTFTVDRVGGRNDFAGTNVVSRFMELIIYQSDTKASETLITNDFNKSFKAFK